MAVDVLQHDDRVVNHQTDRQHQRQQRQGVNAKTRQRHQGESAHQRHWNGQQRNQRGAQRAQEEKDHQRHQHHRLEDGAVDRLDRSVDENRVVIRDRQRHTRWQVSLQLHHQLLHARRQVQRIGCCLADDAQRHRIAAVEPHIGTLVGRTGLHLGHVADAHRHTVDGADHDLAKFPRLLQVGRSRHVEFALLAFDTPGRNLQVRPTNRVFDILHRQPIGRQSVRVEPDPHRKLALPVDQHIGGAGRRL